MFFLLFLLVVKGSRSGSVQIKTDADSDPGGQKTYRSYGSTILQYHHIGANSFIVSFKKQIFLYSLPLSFFFSALPSVFLYYFLRVVSMGEALAVI
jgi:hypothetical protein